VEDEEMRRGIKRTLDKIYPTYNVGTPSATTVKPYLSLRIDTPIESKSLGRYMTFSVICYADLGNPLQLDNMVEEVKEALDKKDIARVSDGTVFVPEYDGMTSDFPDDTLKALSKEVRFKVPVFGKAIM
jgi:hypothetical protein